MQACWDDGTPVGPATIEFGAVPALGQGGVIERDVLSIEADPGDFDAQAAAVRGSGERSAGMVARERMTISPLGRGCRCNCGSAVVIMVWRARIRLRTASTTGPDSTRGAQDFCSRRVCAAVGAKSGLSEYCRARLGKRRRESSAPPNSPSLIGQPINFKICL